MEQSNFFLLFIIGHTRILDRIKCSVNKQNKLLTKNSYTHGPRGVDFKLIKRKFDSKQVF